MICYATSGYTIFSLRKLKVYGDCGPGAECPASDIRAGGQITQKLYYSHETSNFLYKIVKWIPWQII